MIQVRIVADDLKFLRDPVLMERAQAGIIDSGLEVFKPLAMAEVPTRTGRGRSMIAARSFWRRGGGFIGIVSPGKAFYLRILATGARWKEDIVPFRYAVNRRGGARRERLSRAALGPARMQGNTRALRFRIGGAWLFRARVVHPDLKPNDWMERAARRGEGPFARAAEAVLDRVLGGRGA